MTFQPWAMATMASAYGRWSTGTLPLKATAPPQLLLLWQAVT